MTKTDQIQKAAEDHAEGYLIYGTKLYTRSRNAFISGATWMQEQDQWIKVRDQQPPRWTGTGFSVDLLFFAEDQTKCGHFIFGLNKFSDGTKCYDAEYWQPLPAGPKPTGK